MGLFDAFKKKENKQEKSPVQNAEALKAAIQQTCSNLTIYCRDANLPYEIAHKYQRGMIIRERGFVDATALTGGAVTNHRYMILSNHMIPMHLLEGDNKWALCVADKGSRFPVLGKAAGNDKRVTVLLHLNDETWPLFKAVDMNIFKSLADHCYHAFAECLNKEPIASVSTKEWLARCQFPVGMTDQGTFFPVDG